MFTEITLKNFRTHKSTTIELHPITLLIGNNNSGKTNFLAGVQHFSQIIKRSNPEYRDSYTIEDNDYFPHRHRLALDKPMSIKIKWKYGSNRKEKVTYFLELYQDDRSELSVCGREKITFDLGDDRGTKEKSSGYKNTTNLLTLRYKINHGFDLNSEEKKLCSTFFKDFAFTFSYHFQPSFLKGISKLEKYSDRIQNYDNIQIPSYLGTYGENFPEVIRYISQKEEQQRTFDRFSAFLRRFASDFQAVRDDSRTDAPYLRWSFDLKRKNKLDEFPSKVLSDGLMKAAAIALLLSLESPPSLILLEEVENGINPGNIQELMSWIWQTTSPNKGYAPQFMITSHSPVVLREFSEYLDHVYTMRLDKRTYESDVRNLNQALDTLVGIGVVDGEIVEDEITGKRKVSIPKYQLAELWYSATIG